MTDLGSETSPLSMTGEQWVLETRTNDPAAPAPDERWIRTDLNEGDRVAALMCGDGTEIPLFPVGLAEETVREARRFNVGGETVFAPLAPLDDASFPERRFQHDDQLHAFHDRVAPGSAIPDSVTNQWPLLDRSDNTVVDEVGSANGTADGTTNVSGNWWEGWAEQFNGTDDLIRLPDSVLWSQEWSIFVTIETTVSDGSEIYSEGNNSDDTPFITPFRIDDSGGVTFIGRDGSGIFVNETSATTVDDGNPHRLGLTYDNGAWQMFIDGSPDISGSFTHPTPTLNTGAFGALDRTGVSNFFEGIEDKPRMHVGTAVSDAMAQEDYNDQPWS